MNSINRYEWTEDDYLVSTNPDTIDKVAVHAYLTRSTWAQGIDADTVSLSINNSLDFGLYHHDAQIGFARLVTDYSTFAYLSDVYVFEEHQGKGLSRFLMSCIHQHPVFAKVRRILLVTTTAPWLYEKFGYEPVNTPNFAWTISRPKMYL